MKKTFQVFCIIGFVLLLMGCQVSSLGEEPTKGTREQITVYGGSVGGVWSIFTEGIAEAYRKEHSNALISSFPGTVAGNPILVHEGKADFAIAESLIATFAYEGKYPFEQPYENIRAVAAIMPVNIFQLVALERAPFDSVEEIIEKKQAIHYSAGEKDALGDLVSASVFEAYGVTYDDLKSFGGTVNFLSGSKTFDMMGDARVDSLGKMVPIPAGDIMEASATLDLKFIPIGERAIQYLVREFQMTPYTMKAGSYDFQKEDYETVNSPTILITSVDTPEELVYQMVEALYEQHDYLMNVHNAFHDVNDETIVEVGSIPLHEGAEKFYRERGLLE